jgi:hypothetical protein
MKQYNLSPFAIQKWEDESDNLIWLPPEFFEWESQKSIFITGSRGTGKTTLLQGFVWSQRLKNKSILDQLEGRDPFEKRYIGIYLSIPNYVNNQFENWPPRNESDDDNRYLMRVASAFSLFLEYGILESFLKAIQELRSADILKFSAEDELEFVKKIVQERQEIRKYLLNTKKITTLSDLRIYFKDLHENIRFCAAKNISLEPAELYPYTQIGEFLAEISEILIELCEKNMNSLSNLNNSHQKQRWSVKICIDQAESLRNYQQKTINSMVGLKSTHISFVIASTEGFLDTSQTFLYRHPLTDADRAHYKLDDIFKDNSKFNELLTSVTNQRLTRILGKTLKIDFKQILGEYDLDHLLDKKFKKSESSKNREFMNIVIRDMEVSNERKNRENPNYIHNYLNQKFKKFSKNLPRRNTGEYRKMLPAAYICICKEFNFDPIYAGFDMIINLSDTCIRDFLKIMHEIFIIENCNAKDFVYKKISIENQNIAIKNASTKKFDSVFSESPDYFNEVSFLVDSFGKITSNIQSASDLQSTFTNPEKGRFVLDLKNIDQNDKDTINQIINEARYLFCIKIIGESRRTKIDDRKIFRLHNLFSPRYGFSFRGSYENLNISPDDLMNLCTLPEENKRDKLIKKLSDRYLKKETYII